MNRNEVSFITTQASELVINKVLRNTYLLLGLTFLFSSLTAYIGVVTGARPMNPLVMLVGAYGLMFLTNILANSALGILSVFAFTGFMGYTLGPVLNFVLGAYANGPQIVSTALGGTGIIFFALSGYALTTKKDFSFMSGFLFIATMVALFAMIAGVFIQVPALQLMISAAFILISSALILMQTSAIIHGGERNYILATVSLYVSIYNLFLSLLQILAAFSGRDDR